MNCIKARLRVLIPICLQTWKLNFVHQIRKLTIEHQAVPIVQIAQDMSGEVLRCASFVYTHSFTLMNHRSSCQKFYVSNVLTKRVSLAYHTQQICEVQKSMLYFNII